MCCVDAVYVTCHVTAMGVLYLIDTICDAICLTTEQLLHAVYVKCCVTTMCVLCCIDTICDVIYLPIEQLQCAVLTPVCYMLC